MKHTDRLIDRFKIIPQGKSLKDVPLSHGQIANTHRRPVNNPFDCGTGEAMIGSRMVEVIRMKETYDRCPDCQRPFCEDQLAPAPVLRDAIWAKLADKHERLCAECFFERELG